MAEMPKDVLQIIHQSGNVYHFKTNIIRFTDDGGQERAWARPVTEMLTYVARKSCYAIGDGDLFVFKPFESVRCVNEAECKIAEAKGGRLSRVESDLIAGRK